MKKNEPRTKFEAQIVAGGQDDNKYKLLLKRIAEPSTLTEKGHVLDKLYKYACRKGVVKREV